MPVSPPVRLPRAEYREIKRIQNEMGCNFNFAFKIWKDRKLGIRWENY